MFSHSIPVSIFDQCLEILTHLFQYRLIEKLARPTDATTRNAYVSEYGKKLATLNKKISIIHAETEGDQALTISSNNKGGHKNKSILSTKSKTLDIRKQIKKIAQSYNEVLNFYKVRF